MIILSLTLNTFLYFILISGWKSDILGFILCLLTPVFLQMYGRHFYFEVMNKYENIEKSEKERLLVPSSLLIIWVLTIGVIILIIMENI